MKKLLYPLFALLILFTVGCGDDDEGVLSVDGNTISVTVPSDAYCEDADGEELPEYTDQSSCEVAGNDWYEASCTLSEYTKQ